jgi:excinuclease ABC subunit A
LDSEPINLVRLRGARVHNLKNVNVDIPRNAFVVFTGISGSGKSSLAFGTLYAEAQRRYFESVSPYARRLSNLLRMLYSRVGDYPRGQRMLYAEDFSPNTPQGACPECHGLGSIYDVTEAAMVPDTSLSIREGAIAAWPRAWHGQNLRDILTTLGYDIDRPWRKLPKKDRDWILYSEEQPSVPVYAGFSPAETRRALRRKMEPSYQGTFTGVRKYVLQTFRSTQSALMKKRAARFMSSAICPVCHGKRLKREALSVTIAGQNIDTLSHLPLNELVQLLEKAAERGSPRHPWPEEKRLAARRIVGNFHERVVTLQHLGLGYLSLERSSPTLSPGELQRLRLATQIRSNLFGVVYVLDEPSAGLHPSDTEALLRALEQLKQGGNSLFVVEHDLEVMRRAEWIVDVGPDAGAHGGRVLYSGPLEGLREIKESHTPRYLFTEAKAVHRQPRPPRGWLELKNITRNNLRALDVSFPIGVLTVVTGVSGAGKSSLVSEALTDLLADRLVGQKAALQEETSEEPALGARQFTSGIIMGGAEFVSRVVAINQKPIGRTPRSNLATYTGFFDDVRRLFAATPAAKSHRYSASRFSFNVKGGRCPTCEGEGFVCVELLFMPSVYAPCPTCHGTRYQESTLQVQYRGKNIAEILGQSVDEACGFFADQSAVHRPLKLLQAIGLGYLRLGQPATELSGGEAQRVKLATELQRIARGGTLYIIDEPTIGLHPADVDKLMIQIQALVDAGNTVIVAEHEMRVAAAADWVIDLGPGAGDAGGRIVIAGTPQTVAAHSASKTAGYLVPLLAASPTGAP